MTLQRTTQFLFIISVYFLALITCQTVSRDDKILKIFGTPLVKNPDVTTPMPPTEAPPVKPVVSEDCVCVNYYQCNGTHINTNGEGLINIRANENEKCASYMEICCPTNERVDKIDPITPTQNTGCGWRNPDGVGFRVTGNIDGESQFGEFPWMVAVLREQTLDTGILSMYQCGGTLIHPEAVVTAAHCVHNRQYSLIIRVGEWDTQNTKEIYRHQNRAVKKVIVHPQYHRGALFNDIAILILETPVDLDLHINVACLPQQGTTPPPGTRCFATGWGKDKFEKTGVYQVILKKIELPFVSRDSCQNALRTTRLGRYFELDKSFVCAGGEKGKDTCTGDGGGPLVCPIPGQHNRYQHIGIVAWGIGCGEEGMPGVYANVPALKNWIDQEIRNNNLDTSVYQY